MKPIQTLLILLSTMLMAQFAQARTIEIDVREYTDVLPIKQIIKEDRPNIKLNRFDLKSVEIVARDAQHVRARLMIAGSVQDRDTFRGERRRRRGRRASVLLQARHRQSKGAWRVKLSDYVEVKYIIVTLKRDRDGHDRPGRLRNVNLGSVKAAKIGNGSNYFHANERKVSKVSVIVESGKVRIHNVWAYTFNGRRINLNHEIKRQLRRNHNSTYMPSSLRAGDKLVARLDRALNIDKIEVEAYSARLNGSRAVYSVKLGVQERY